MEVSKEKRKVDEMQAESNKKGKGMAGSKGGGEKGSEKGNEKGGKGKGGKDNLDSSLLLAVAHLSLEAMATSRENSACSSISMLVDIDWECTREGLEEGKIFNEQVKAQPGENIGSPHVRIAMKFFMALGRMPGLEPSFLEKLMTWWKNSIQQKDASEVALAIPLFKLRKPQVQKSDWQKKKGSGGESSSSAASPLLVSVVAREGDEEEWVNQYAKLQMSLRDQGLMMLIVEALEKQGGSIKAGPAPKSHNERDVLKKLKEVMKRRSS